MEKILIIYHGAKISQDEVSNWSSMLTNGGYSVTVNKTNCSGDARKYANATGFNTIIAMGGDGTINEVVNGIKESENEALFTFVPKGTGNDFNRSISGFYKPELLLSSLKENSFHEIDLIKLTSANVTRYCCNIADVGLGGLVVKHVEEYRSQKLRNAYFKAILKGFKKYTPEEVEIEIDDRKLVYEPLLIAFANGNFFGNGIGISPQANLSNGRMNLTIINKVSVLTYLKFLPKLKKGKIIKDDRIIYCEAKRVLVKPGNLMFEVDGESIEFGNNQAVDIEVKSKALKVLI